VKIQVASWAMTAYSTTVSQGTAARLQGFLMTSWSMSLPDNNAPLVVE